jgi:hypothetical protein
MRKVLIAMFTLPSTPISFNATAGPASPATVETRARQTEADRHPWRHIAAGMRPQVAHNFRLSHNLHLGPRQDHPQDCH